MKYNFKKRIKRIELHDSSIEKLQSNAEGLLLEFNWAKIEDFYEKKMECLILGECRLKLNGIRKNLLEVETKEEKNLIDFPDNFPQELKVILESFSENDNQIRISGFSYIGNDSKWVNWIIEFDDFEFSWDYHVTYEDWKNGILPKRER